jgi:transposase
MNMAPHRCNRRKRRRYKRRWKVERLFAWLGNFRRLPVRYGRHLVSYLGFVHMACIVILFRRHF